ncbi:hypothetical protein BGY98DRAFT_1018898 [Russula aff. rugulosa BPL654]|nr:hypothetical protein BGY98DRAFT_1018898 [Russula aff. rugulosa BPL654]
MVGPFTSVYNCEESLPIQAIFDTHRARSARAYWGKNNRSVSRSAKCSLGGISAIGTCRGGHCAVHFCATAHQSPCLHFCLV